MNTPPLSRGKPIFFCGILMMHEKRLTWCVCSVYNTRMKRRDLIKRLEAAGFRFDRHGGKHDIYKRGRDEEQVPRHTEINEMLAKAILRKWGL